MRNKPKQSTSTWQITDRSIYTKTCKPTSRQQQKPCRPLTCYSTVRLRNTCEPKKGRRERQIPKCHELQESHFLQGRAKILLINLCQHEILVRALRLHLKFTWLTSCEKCNVFPLALVWVFFEKNSKRHCHNVVQLWHIFRLSRCRIAQRSFWSRNCMGHASNLSP